MTGPARFLASRLPGPAIALAMMCIVTACAGKPRVRGVAPSGPNAAGTQEDGGTAPFDARQSAGLFVGIEEFPANNKGDRRDQLPAVDYAVDDAVDLAYLFAMELRLVDPSRVRMLLSGSPSKEGSKQRLASLLAAGAAAVDASRSAILGHLDFQSRNAGPEGLLIVSFATHGISEGGFDYLLAADSIDPYLKTTSLELNTILDTIARTEARRKIVLLDACRAVNSEARGPGKDSSRGVATAIARVEGEVILSAARPGGNAFPDHDRQNGVFTAAVLDGLRCQAPPDTEGWLRGGSLAWFVNQRVAAWMKQHRPEVPPYSRGIEYRIGGPAAEMALTQCPVPPGPAESSVQTPIQPCHQTRLDAIEIYLGSGKSPRIEPPQAEVRFRSQDVKDLENLTGRAILSHDGGALQSCPCAWKRFDADKGEWTSLQGEGDGCAFSISPPQPTSEILLGLNIGKQPLIPIVLKLERLSE